MITGSVQASREIFGIDAKILLRSIAIEQGIIEPNHPAPFCAHGPTQAIILPAKAKDVPEDFDFLIDIINHEYLHLILWNAVGQATGMIDKIQNLQAAGYNHIDAAKTSYAKRKKEALQLYIAIKYGPLPPIKIGGKMRWLR